MKKFFKNNIQYGQKYRLLLVVSSQRIHPCLFSVFVAVKVCFVILRSWTFMNIFFVHVFNSEQIINLNWLEKFIEQILDKYF